MAGVKDNGNGNTPLPTGFPFWEEGVRATLAPCNCTNFPKDFSLGEGPSRQSAGSVNHKM